MKTITIDEVYGKSGYKVLVSDLPWRMHATHGISLDLSLPVLADEGFIPAWDLLFEAAAKDGANLSRLSSRICEIVVDVYPPRVAKAIRACLPYVS